MNCSHRHNPKISCGTTFAPGQVWMWLDRLYILLDRDLEIELNMTRFYDNQEMWRTWCLDIGQIAHATMHTSEDWIRLT